MEYGTYDVSVLKLSNVSFQGKCARMGNTLKILSATKLARPGHFSPASQAGRLAGPVFYVYLFSLFPSTAFVLTPDMVDLELLPSGSKNLS
jgi:hypothetical protein